MQRTLLLSVLAAAALLPARARADDKSDCIAAFEAGQTLRVDRKLTLALPKLALCAREVCPPSLQKQCANQARETTAQLPTIVLSAKDSSGTPLVDVKVTIDDAVVATSLDGRAFPIDPGIHKLVFEHGGSPSITRRWVVNEGQKDQAVAVQFATEVSPAVPTAVSPSPVVAPAARAEEPSSGSALRYVGVGAGAFGLASIAVGSAFGVFAFNKSSQAHTACPGVGCANVSQANSDNKSGETDGTVSTVTFVAGGLLVAGGVVLFLVAPSKHAGASAAIVPLPGGLGLTGTF